MLVKGYHANFNYTFIICAHKITQYHGK